MVRLFLLLFEIASALCAGAHFDRAAASDPVALVEQAKTLLPARNNVASIISLLANAVEIFKREGDESVAYAEALELLTLLGVRSNSHLSPNPREAADLALQICELHAEPTSDTLALALELKATTVDRKIQPLLLARAFQVRGARVAMVQPEVPLSLKLPIAESKTKGVKFPTVITGMKPTYPDLARHLSLECLGVLLDTVIDTAGVPGQFHLLKGCGYGFDENAVAALRKWRFHPALNKDHRPVAFTVNVQLNFRILEGG